MSAIINYAGPVVRVRTHVRQRCMWCGATIIDQDVALINVALAPGKTEEQARADGDLDYPTWEPGSWVGVDGGVRWVERSVADDTPDTPSPEGSCMRIDPAVTR